MGLLAPGNCRENRMEHMGHSREGPWDGLNCVPSLPCGPKCPMWNSEPLVPRTVSTFGDRAFKEIIKVK